MSDIRLHINVTEGILEAEGNAAFVERVYNDFKAALPEGNLGAIFDRAKKPKKPHPED